MLNIFLSQEGSSLSHSKLIPAQPLEKKMYFAKLCQTVEKGNSKRTQATWNKNTLGRDLSGVGFCTTSFGSLVLKKIITVFDLNSSSLSLSLYSLNIL